MLAISTALRSVWALRLFMAVAGACGLIYAIATPVSHGTFDGEMAVNCDDDSPVIVSTCQFNEEDQFFVEIQAPQAPAGGYTAFQVQLRWDGPVLDYKPASDLSQEVLWPSCFLPLRLDNRPGDTSVEIGCITPLGQSTHSGTLVRLEFTCVAPGTSQLTLVPGNSYFSIIDGGGSQTTFDPVISNATITCKGAGAPTGSPSATPPDGTSETSATPNGTSEPPSTPNPVGGYSIGADLQVLDASLPESSTNMRLSWFLPATGMAAVTIVIALCSGIWWLRRSDLRDVH